MPGLIGKTYAEMGGTAHYVGKPYSAVYERSFQVLQVSKPDGLSCRVSQRGRRKYDVVCCKRKLCIRSRKRYHCTIALGFDST